MLYFSQPKRVKHVHFELCVKTKNTLGKFILLTGLSFEIKNHIVEFLDDKLALIIAFVSDIENGVFVGWFIVNVKDDVGLWDGDDIGDVFGFWADSTFPNGDVHVGGIFL